MVMLKCNSQTRADAHPLPQPAALVRSHRSAEGEGWGEGARPQQLHPHPGPLPRLCKVIREVIVGRGRGGVIAPMLAIALMASPTFAAPPEDEIVAVFDEQAV